MKSRFALLLIFAAWHSAFSDSTIDFEKDIEPILRANCFDCHGTDAREGGLRLTNRNDALLPADSGSFAIVPTHPEKSSLIERLKTNDAAVRMPLDADPLSSVDITKLENWIRQGAKYPKANLTNHWAYEGPRKSALPNVQNRSWPINELDHFVLARMEQNDLAPEPKTNAARLIRRVYLDLIGLPPTNQEVDQFVANPSEEKYAELIDRLLASKHYGEKWARRWLDMARYSDSNGYQADQIRDMWAFRDWVIRAMNDDMPFDQFTIEQIAGDLLPNATLSQKIATGFHRATTCNVEAGVDPEGNRTDQIIDRVNTTATVWLGTTLECAQCHNHKYDPFSQKDYYQVFAFFNKTPMEVKRAGNGVQFDFWGPKLELPMTDAQRRMKQELSDSLGKVVDTVRDVEQSALANFTAWEQNLTESKISKLAKPVQAILKISTDLRKPKQVKKLQEAFLAQDTDVAKIRSRQKELKKKLQEVKPATTLVMTDTMSRDTNILIRGQFLNKGVEVVADAPAILHGFPQNEERNRLGFAKWLVSKQNPLVARVVVNRWWNEIFGRGLVTTSEDFGTQGDPPSHPKLLDWLAVDFMENNWSMKHIHKLICMSATYRQSSKITQEKLERDPQNIWLSRGARIRLPAELIRDNALKVSGLLSDGSGGPPVYPPQPDGLWKQTGRNEPVYQTNKDEKRFRRGIYVVWRRAAPPPGFVAFDAPDRMSCVVDRPVTNTPLQALNLMNDAVFVEAAKHLASRIVIELPESTIEQKIEFAFQSVLARKPNQPEIQVLARLFRQELAQMDAKKQKSFFESFPKTLPNLSKRQMTEIAAWFAVTNTLLNLDEAITKS